MRNFYGLTFKNGVMNEQAVFPGKFRWRGEALAWQPRGEGAKSHCFSAFRRFFCVTDADFVRRILQIGTMKPYTRLSLVLALPLAVLAAAACSTASGENGVARISKVNPYHLKPGRRVETSDRMVAFEHRHRVHGAVTAEEFLAKFGHYFTVFWHTKARGSDFTVRLEYTQGGTGPEVHVKEVAVPSAKGSNATEIAVTGEEYRANGPVTSWKASVVSGGQTVAEYKSFLWK